MEGLTLPGTAVILCADFREGHSVRSIGASPMNDRHAEHPAGAGRLTQPLRDHTAAFATSGHGAGTPAPVNAEAILAGISDGIIALDNDWRLVYVNPAVQRMWGRDIRPLIGRPIEEVLDLSPDNPFRMVYMTSKQNGEPVAFTGFSEVFGSWVDVRGYPHAAGYTILFRSETGDRRGAGVIMDSERERERIRSINQRIFDTSLDLILVVDGHGEFIRVSPSSLAILGYAPEEMTGHNGTRFVFPDDLDNVRDEMRQARKGRLSRSFECRYVHRDGHVVPVAWTGIWSESDRQYFFIGRDMTDRIMLESQLRQAQKMEAVGQLTGGVAHDFNNILTVIIGMTELLSDSLGQDPKLGPIVQAIDEAASRGAQLTQRMLAFARKQPLQARNIDLNEVMSRASAMLRHMIGEDISIKVQLAEGLWPALVDPAQIEDVVLNLAINARDAMPNGGQLLIETANTHLDQTYAAHNVEVMPGDYVSLVITDSGVGMPPEVVERVFEPFFTTKEIGRGTGLGLSMVYGFVKQSRGHVKIYSEVGHGTSIKLYLPRADAPMQEEVPVARPSGHPVGTESILVVEDSAPVRSVTVSILRALGYQVHEAEDGPSALAILSGPTALDLLFTDLIMPNGIDGQELLRRARALRPGLKALFASGYSEQFLKGRGPAEAGVPLLNKPYRTRVLAETVRGVLDAKPTIA
jgi:PAS domain S-box-containing protein